MRQSSHGASSHREGPKGHVWPGPQLMLRLIQGRAPEKGPEDRFWALWAEAEAGPSPDTRKSAALLFRKLPAEEVGSFPQMPTKVTTQGDPVAILLHPSRPFSGDLVS